MRVATGTTPSPREVSSGVDTVVLEGVNPVASALRETARVRVMIAESTPGAGDGGSILLKDRVDDWFGLGLEQIVFADGTIWTRADIRTKLISQAGTPGNDAINGASTCRHHRRWPGNDTINGEGGADTYIYDRGDGNDTIADKAIDNGIDKLTLTGVNPSRSGWSGTATT